MLATRDKSLEQDFRELRKNLEQAGLFKANLWFYFAMLAHIILLELAGWAVLKYLGTSWPSYCLAVCLLVTAQAQAGWLQHDFGHLSVFESRELNLFCHRFVILHLKAASSAWWNYRHYLHHAKPNIAEADPDINMPYVFMLGLSLCRSLPAHALLFPSRTLCLSPARSLAPSVNSTHTPSLSPSLSSLSDDINMPCGISSSHFRY
jgi:fatty acid desaturase